MNFDNLHPVSGDHAVQAVHFVVEWGDPLSSDLVLALAKLHTKFRSMGYPNMVPQNRVSFKVEVGSNPSSAATHAIAGYLFSQLPQEQLSRQISVTAENCTIMFPDYTRWGAVFGSVKEILKVILEEVGAHRPIRSIGLQYNDAFTWNDDPDELDLKAVFNNTSVIPPNVFLQRGLWHLHHGYFESFSSPVPHTVLQNINVDMVEKGALRQLQILGSHKATLKDVMWQPFKKNKDHFLQMFEHLHALNKDMIRALLTEKVRERIKLDA